MHPLAPGKIHPALKPLLNLLSLGYKGMAWLVLAWRARRQRLFPEACLISIDNLSFGGTGKTALVCAIGTLLEEVAIPFAIIARGYRGRLSRQGTMVLANHAAAEVGDDALLLKSRFPQRDIFIARNRLPSICQALARKNRVLIMDDGLQSTYVSKNLAIMLVNPGHPYYYLRHFHFLRKRADLVLTYSADPAVAGQAGSDTYTIQHAGFYNREGGRVDIGSKSIVAFSALGDNSLFQQLLAQYNLRHFVQFPDHHQYTQGEICRLDQERKRFNACYLVATEKDFTKVRTLDLSAIPFLYARNRIQYDPKLREIVLAHAQRKNIPAQQI
jgi:tetraacyldisaccharide 4'-kinase